MSEMRLLDRYILTQITLPMLVCTAGFLIFWISGDALSRLDDFKSLQIHPVDGLKYYLLKIPGYLDLLGPVAFLLSLLYAFIQLTRSNETTAMRAAGISLWRIALPILFISLVFGVVSFIYRELYLVDFETQADAIAQNNGSSLNPQDNAPISQSQSLLFYWNETEGRRLDVGNIQSTDDQTILVDVTVEYIDPKGKSVFVCAEKAYYSQSVWHLSNAQVFVNNQTLGFPVLESKPAHLEIPDSILPETPEFVMSQLKISRVQDIKDARLAKFNIREIAHIKKFLPTLSNADSLFLSTKYHSQIAGSLTFFVVGLLAIPLGCRPGRRDAFRGVTLALGLCFTYFVVQRLSEPLGFSGKIHPILAAWSPNFLFASLGLILFLRADKN